jgi:hypothetical protein
MNPIRAVCLASSVLAALTAQKQPVFRTRADAVVVDVSVQDRGKPVIGLTPSDFELLDNGRPQAIASLSIDSVPLDVTVLMDISESLDVYPHHESMGMNPGETVRPRIEGAVRSLAALLRPNDRLQPLRFGGGVSGWSPSEVTTPGQERFRTSLFDSIVASAMHPPVPGRRRVVMVVTDGVDTASTVPEHLRNIVLDRSDVVVHVIVMRRAFGAIWFPRSDFRRYEWVLQDLCGRTGGRYFDASSGGDIMMPLRAALDEFRTRYTLTFQPAGVTPGGWHELKVTLPGKRYNIVHRRGYWVE